MPAEQSPLVSIIMPAYRSQPFIGRAVTSLLEQSYPYWELLLVSDDGQDYQQHLQLQGITDPRIHHLYSEGIATGPNAARNRGLAAAKGELIAPLDTDDFFYPERLASLVPLALEFGVAADNVDVCESDSGAMLYRPFEASEHLTVLKLEHLIDLSTPLLLIFKRELIKQLWNPAVKLGEDTLFNLRIVEAAGQLVFNRWPLHAYCVHDQSICHRPDAAALAEQAYSYCIQQISVDGLGFSSEQYRREVLAMLKRKRALNRRYQNLQQTGMVGNFQEFIATIDQLNSKQHGLAN